MGIRILQGYPYIIGLHCKGGLHGISLFSCLLMCFLGGPIMEGTLNRKIQERRRNPKPGVSAEIVQLLD